MIIQLVVVVLYNNTHPNTGSRREDMSEYRNLKHGEIIQEGDERDMCNDGWRDPAKWVEVKPEEVGQKAPDPQYPSHRQYRRKVEQQ